MLTISNTTEGYLKNVEIKGNTVQNPTNLADIKSVGKKLENQDLYEIPLLCTGKNLINIQKNKTIGATNGIVSNSDINSIAYIYHREGNKYSASINGVLANNFSDTVDCIVYFDMNNKYIDKQYQPINVNNIPPNTRYFVLRFINEKIANKNIQLEEGTTATPYESYKSNKITILSPVQLEKVGDIADRIIEKNGVWGVEKNIVTEILKGNETINVGNIEVNEKTSMFRYKPKFKCISHRAISNLIAFSTNNVWSMDEETICSYEKDQLIDWRINNNKLSSKDVTAMKKYLNDNNLLVKYITSEPQFIPLPHDQQVLLKTFDNKTNISFLTEIEGTIKAQVPKSIKATVNTHTSQIENIYDELDRVKKLEESTVSTVSTDNDFANVQATTNGYFEDVKLEGKTKIINSDGIEVEPGTEGATLKSVGDGVDEIVVSSVDGDGNLIKSFYDATASGLPIQSFNIKDDYSFEFNATTWGQGLIVDVGNVIKGETYVILADSAVNSLVNGYDGLMTSGNDLNLSEKNRVEIVATSTGKARLRFKNSVASGNVSFTNVRVVKKGADESFSKHKADKKRILYYDTTDNTWKKPVLREWDTIEKHANGKYYYHQRSIEEDYVGGDELKSDCITDMTKTVKKLAQEKVFECTNIDLITYQNETNYVFTGGVISPRTSLKVHSNISNVVSLLQKKVSVIEERFLNHVITQNRLQLASTYSTDSVTFKVDYNSKSVSPLDNDLYNLIKKNILVGKDNYDYDTMCTMLLDYASWSQITWDQYDELMAIVDEQQNPTEELPEEAPVL